MKFFIFKDFFVIGVKLRNTDIFVRILTEFIKSLTVRSQTKIKGFAKSLKFLESSWKICLGTNELNENHLKLFTIIYTIKYIQNQNRKQYKILSLTCYITGILHIFSIGFFSRCEFANNLHQQRGPLIQYQMKNQRWLFAQGICSLRK